MTEKSLHRQAIAKAKKKAFATLTRRPITPDAEEEAAAAEQGQRLAAGKAALARDTV